MNNIQSTSAELQNLLIKVEATPMPAELLEAARNKIGRVSQSVGAGGNIYQMDMIAKYIDWITALPWGRQSADSLSLDEAKKIMDKNHHSLSENKQRILEYISMRILQKKQSDIVGMVHAPILFFVGLSGTGKTTFARSVAEALGRVFVRIPFGAIASAADLRGMSKQRAEAEPGGIIKAMRRANYNNPVILLDELDRIPPESRAEIMGVLIELLDPEQNAMFTDHYIDYPFDLSQVIFIATANNTTSISTAVLDRLEVIAMPSYTDDEKIIIGKEHIFPRLLKEGGLTTSQLTIDDAVWHTMARASGYDPGVRSIERKIEMIVRKVSYKIVKGEGQSFAITSSNFSEYIE